MTVHFFHPTYWKMINLMPFFNQLFWRFLSLGMLIAFGIWGSINKNHVRVFFRLVNDFYSLIILNEKLLVFLLYLNWELFLWTIFAINFYNLRYEGILLFEGWRHQFILHWCQSFEIFIIVFCLGHNSKKIKLCPFWDMVPQQKQPNKKDKLVFSPFK